jgi:transposase
MTEQALFAGIDVSKYRLDAAMAPGGEHIGVATSDLPKLIAWLMRHRPKLVVVEATGGYERQTVAALAAEGLAVAVVNPRQVRDFARATGRLAKTDKIDAGVLAAFALTVQPEPRPLQDEQAYALRDLVVRRRQLLDMRKAERNRLQTRLSAAVRTGLERHLVWLDSEIAQTDDDLDDMIRHSPAWRADEELIRSTPGAGPVLAKTLIAELPERGLLSNRQIAAWSASPRSIVTQARCVEPGPSGADGPASEPCSTWPPCRLCGIIQFSSASTSICEKPASRPRSPSQPACAGSSSPSTPC